MKASFCWLPWLRLVQLLHSHNSISVVRYKLLPPVTSYKLALTSILAWQQPDVQLILNHWFGKNLFNFMLAGAITELNIIWFGTAMARRKNKRLYSEILWPITDLLCSQLLFRELLKQRPPVTKQFFIASDWSSVEFMIVVSGKLSWNSLFPQFETKQATGSEWWQISTKWLKKRFAEVNENEKDRIHLLIQQYLKTHKNDTVWVECF